MLHDGINNSFGEYKTIVFHDFDHTVDAIQQEAWNTKLEWTLKKYRDDNNNINDTELDDNAPVFQLIIQAVLMMS